MKKIISLALALLVLLALALPLASCNEDKDGGDNNTPSVPSDGTTKTCTVEVKSVLGKPLANVTVELTSQNDEFIAYKITGLNGKVSFTVDTGANCKIKLSDLPSGYKCEESYQIDGDETIVLDTEIIKEQMPSNHRYPLGSIMYDFTVVDQNGNNFTLSEVLKEKDMVLINFWYNTCRFCVLEFPGMNDAYDEYSSKVGLIGLNVYPNQSIRDFITNFSATYNKYNGTSSNPVEVDPLTLPLANDTAGVQYGFNVQACPTSIIIDKYGAVSFVHVGAIEESEFCELFEYYTSDSYTHKTFSSYSDFKNKTQNN